MAKNIVKSNIKIIAEIANTHQGDLKYLFKLLKELKKNKIRYIKFQIYTADELLVNHHKRYKHFLRQSFNFNQWDKIINFSNKNFKICFDVFGEDSLDYILKKKNIYGIKIHSSDLLNKSILLKLANFKKNIFISTGGSNFREIDYVLSNLKKKPTLMHGFQNYPTEINETNLNRINKFQEIYKNKVNYGLQDHLKGDSEEAKIIPLLSLPYNLSFLEKHVILKRDKKRVDNFSALEPFELNELNKKIIYYQKAFEDRSQFSKNEINYRKVVKKNWVAKRNINIGEKFSLKNIQMKRVNNKNFEPFFFEELEGEICKKKLKKNQLITKKNFKNKVLALIIVRSKSNRLKNKALLKIKNKTCLEILIKRLSYSKLIDQTIVCTTKNKNDDKIVRIAKANKIEFFRGSSLNVLSRMIGAQKKYNGQLIVRVTGDDILIDPEYLDKTIDLSIKSNANYVTNKGIPSGCEVEVFTKKCLQDLKKYSQNPNGTEYLTNYINDNRNEFSALKLAIPKIHKKDYRLTIDTKKDFQVVKKIIENFSDLKFSLNNLIKFYNKNKFYFKNFNKYKQKQIPIKYSTSMNWGR